MVLVRWWVEEEEVPLPIHRCTTHSPIRAPLKMVGLSRFELLTPRLSSVCSNQLSYRPLRLPIFKEPGLTIGPILSKLDRRACLTTTVEFRVRSISKFPCLPERRDAVPEVGSSRKEVIQPQVLLQLPCYDFTPITDHTLGTCLPCGLAQLLLVQPAFVM